jgi:hypothetical protein
MLVIDAESTSRMKMPEEKKEYKRLCFRHEVQSNLFKRDVKKQLNSPHWSKIPLTRRDLSGARVKKAKESVPLRLKSRLKGSRLKECDCTSFVPHAIAL